MARASTKDENAKVPRALSRILRVEVWEQMRHSVCVEGRGTNWIASQPWAPSKPTVIRALRDGTTVRHPDGSLEQKLAISELRLELGQHAPTAVRSALGASRVLAVVEAVRGGDSARAAQEVVLPLQPVAKSPPKRTKAPAEAKPALQPKAPPPPRAAAVLPPPRTNGTPDASSSAPAPVPAQAPPVAVGAPVREGATAQTVLRELARLDGTEALAEETRILRQAKTTAGGLLALATNLLTQVTGSKSEFHQRLINALRVLPISTFDDLRDAITIEGMIVGVVDRATKVVERVLLLEREMLGDPRDVVGATGAPGESFAFTSDEAVAELKRLAPMMERYGVPVSVGGTAEIETVDVSGSDPAPSVFVAARDDDDVVDGEEESGDQP